MFLHAETGGLRIGCSFTDLSAALEIIQRNGVRVAFEVSLPHALIRDPEGHWTDGEIHYVIIDIRINHVAQIGGCQAEKSCSVHSC